MNSKGVIQNSVQTIHIPYIYLHFSGQICIKVSDQKFQVLFVLFVSVLRNCVMVSLMIMDRHIWLQVSLM